jgi:WD40 repeat protein
VLWNNEKMNSFLNQSPNLRASWDIEKEKEKTTLRGHNGWVMAVTATADGKYVISASYDGTIRVCDLEKGENISCFTGDNSFWTCDVLPDLSQGGELIIAGDTLGKMHFLHFDKPY